MGGKIVGGTSLLPLLVQPGRASLVPRPFLVGGVTPPTRKGLGTKLWQSVKQILWRASFVAVTFTNSLSVSSTVSQEFSRPLLVKLLIEENVVKVLPSTSSTILFILCTT